MKKFINENTLAVFVFSITCFISFVYGELYFYSTRGMDYGKYKSFISYFQGISETTGHGQGVIYYYLIAFISELRASLLNNLNQGSFNSSNIQILNMFLYLFGLRGFYLILRRYQFSKNIILYCFSFLNFFPATFEMRILMKPEIAAFALLPWLLLVTDDLFEKFDYKKLVFASVIASLIFTLKGSIFGMIGAFLFIKYAKKIYMDKRKIVIFITIFISVFSFLYFENFNINQIHLLDHNTEDYEAYQNKASVNFIYHLNEWDFYYFPIRDYHNNSLIGITLFDTFGDYFDLTYNNDSTYLAYEREVYFTDGLTKTFSRQYLALILSLVFYFLLAIFYIREKRFRLYLFSPLIGIAILLINAFGFPNLNFDPLTGDTFKVHYYSFFLTVSFIFLTSILLSKKKFLAYIVLIFFSLSSIYIVGFPKNDNNNIDFYLSSKNSISPFCNITNFTFDDGEKSNCNKPENMCLFNPNAEIVNKEILSKKIENDFNLDPVILISDTNLIYKTSSPQECFDLVKNGSNFDNGKKIDLKFPPLVNLSYFLVVLFVVPIYLKESNE
tara:strand:- start:272 stop:1942 length:1671 start_codon:yes stop_codon:yes gene_type:complete